MGKLWLSVLAALYLPAITASAQTGITLQHDSYWAISNRTVTIQAAQVSNSGNEDTGPVFLSVYTRAGWYYDGSGPLGQLLARAPLENIPAGQTLQNIVVQTRLRPVRPGAKYTTLVVERQNGRTFTTLDWVVFTSPYLLITGQNGGVGSFDSAIGVGDIATAGVALSGSGRRAKVQADLIQNQRETGYTGTLRLAVYASKTPFTGDGTPGQLLGARTLGTLAPGDYYTSVASSLLLRTPRAHGLYYLTLRVEEQGDSGFVPLTYVTESTRRRL